MKNKPKTLSVILSSILITGSFTTAYAAAAIQKHVFDIKGSSGESGSDTQGDLLGRVSFAQHIIMPSKRGIPNDVQPHVFSDRKTMIIFHPDNAAKLSKNMGMAIKDANGNTLYEAEMLEPENITQIADDTLSKEIVYSNNSFSSIVAAEYIKPGISITFTNDGKTSELTDFQVGAPTVLQINTIDIGMLTPPRDKYVFARTEEYQRQFYNNLPVSKLVVNQYGPAYLREIMLPNGTLLTDYDPSHHDWYGSDSNYRIARELISAGINMANYGINSSSVRPRSTWSIDAPYPAAQITVHNSIGNYANGPMVHGGIASNVGVVTVQSSTGNEFSHEVGHDLGGNHYMGGFFGSVHNASTERNSTWGWDVHKNYFIPNFSPWLGGASCYDGQCAEPFAGRSFSFGTMAGGRPFYERYNAYTLATPYESNAFQRLLETKAVINPESPTGFSKWNTTIHQMEVWRNTAHTLIAGAKIIDGNSELRAIGNNPKLLLPYLNTNNIVEIRTGDERWAPDFTVLSEGVDEGAKLIFISDAAWNSEIYIGDNNYTLSTGGKYAFLYNDGAWTQVSLDSIDPVVELTPTNTNTPVTTLVGYYDPLEELQSYVYPALHGASGLTYNDVYSQSACQLQVEIAENDPLTFNLHDRRLTGGLMNKFHINVPTNQLPSKAHVICNGRTLHTRILEAPVFDIKRIVIDSNIKASYFPLFSEFDKELKAKDLQNLNELKAFIKVKYKVKDFKDPDHEQSGKAGDIFINDTNGHDFFLLLVNGKHGPIPPNHTSNEQWLYLGTAEDYINKIISPFNIQPGKTFGENLVVAFGQPEGIYSWDQRRNTEESYKLFGYNNPYNGQKDYFQQKQAGAFSYYPTHQTSDQDWFFMGSEAQFAKRIVSLSTRTGLEEDIKGWYKQDQIMAWSNSRRGTPGDIYFYNFRGDCYYYRLKSGTYSYYPHPVDGVGQSNGDWEYMGKFNN